MLRRVEGEGAFVSLALSGELERAALSPEDRALATEIAYGVVRHPFYVSFLLMQIGAMLLLPHVITVFGFVAAFLSMNMTAAREEKRLSASEFGADYVAYKARTGRFFPRLVKA